jgi:hypothetical protein
MTETRYRILVTLTDEDQGHRFAEWDEDVPDWLMNDDDTPNMGAIYRASQQDYGRCTGSVYIDRKEGPPKRIGWFFVSRDRTGDTHEPYLRGAWITVVEETPAVRNYVEVGR